MCEVPSLLGLCLIAKEMEQEVTITLFIISDNVTKERNAIWAQRVRLPLRWG